MVSVIMLAPVKVTGSVTCIDETHPARLSFKGSLVHHRPFTEEFNYYVLHTYIQLHLTCQRSAVICSMQAVMQAVNAYKLLSTDTICQLYKRYATKFVSSCQCKTAHIEHELYLTMLRAVNY